MTYIITGYLWILSIIDIRKRKIPLAAATLPIVAAVIYGLLCREFTGIILGSLPGLWLFVISLLLPDSLGQGDGLVIVACGILLGWRFTCIWVLIAMLLAAVAGLILRVWKRYKGEIPFIPFLAVVFTCSLF